MEFSTMDSKGQNATEFLNELADMIEANKKIKIEPCCTPVKYKRGFLAISVGKYEKKTMWVQLGGLLLSYFERPDVRLVFSYICS